MDLTDPKDVVLGVLRDNGYEVTITHKAIPTIDVKITKNSKSCFAYISTSTVDTAIFPPKEKVWFRIDVFPHNYPWVEIEIYDTKCFDILLEFLEKVL